VATGIEIRYRGELAARVEEGWELAPGVSALDPGHPVRNFVSLIAVYASCFRDEAFDQVYAEQVARQALMPVEDFSPWPRVEDEEIVWRYCIPLEQVRARRAELRLPDEV
jgi:hypothetical protein